MDSKSREQGEVKELMFHSGGVLIVHGLGTPVARVTTWKYGLLRRAGTLSITILRLI